MKRSGGQRRLALPWEKPEAPISDPLQDWIILPSGPLGLYESAERAFTILAKSETAVRSRRAGLSDCLLLRAGCFRWRW